MNNNLIVPSKPDFEVINAKLLSKKKERKNKTGVSCVSNLFQTFYANGLNFKNHFAFINLTDVEFYDDKKHDFYDYYINLAKTNIGLIITGGIDLKLLGQKIDVYSNNSKSLIREQINNIHSYGTKIFLQIKQFYGRGIDRNKCLNKFNYSPSYNNSYNNSSKLCARISDFKCNEIIYEINKLCHYAKDVGYDGILLNGDMFNIIGEFSSCEFNRRYFGYYSNIGELSIKILKNLKKDFSKFNIFYSITIDNFLNEIYGKQLKSIKSTSKISSKTSFKFICEFLILLINNGVDGFIFNFGTYETEFFNINNEFQDEYLYFEYYKEIKNWFTNNNIKNKFGYNVIIIYKDNINYFKKVSLYLDNNIFDFIDVTKQIFADEEFLLKLNNLQDYKPCIKCSYCNYMANNSNINSCLVNPRLFNKIISKDIVIHNKNIAIIGAGLSGLMCAIYLLERGFSVDIFEKNEKLNEKRKKYELFDFCKLTKDFNHYIENMLLINANNCQIYLKTYIKTPNSLNNKYDAIIIATGTNEKYLNIAGSILKSVISINEILTNENMIKSYKNYIIYATTELSLKFALYLLANNKKVTVIFPNFDYIKEISNDKFTYYFYELSKLNTTIYIDARVNKIEQEFIELVINKNINKNNILSTILNLKSNNMIKRQDKLILIDYDCFVYEPELTENNKLYYDIVSSGYTGEVYMIGNALKICDDAECIKSAYFVAKNL